MSKPFTVAVLSPAEGGFYYGGVLAGITREIGAAGGRVLLVQTLDSGLTNDQLPGTPPYQSPTSWDQADGFIVLAAAAPPDYLRRLCDTGKPVVMAGHRVDGIDAPSAMPDNFGGIRTVVDHLVAHGHTRIGFVGNLTHVDTLERHQAYVAALAEHDLPLDADIYFPVADHTEVAGRAVAPAVAAACARMTAVVVATDRNALGLLEALPHLGIQPGRDLAIIGFDDVEMARCSIPTLSTVSQGCAQLGEVAGRLILAKLRGDDVPAGRYTTPSLFIARESCGCADKSLDTGAESTAVEDAGDSPTAAARKTLTNRVRELVAAARQRGPADGSAAAVAVERIADHLDRVAQLGELPERTVLRAAALQVYRAHLPLETAGALVSALTEYGAALVGSVPEGGAKTQLLVQQAVIQTIEAMLEAQAQANAIRMMSTELFVRDQYAIGVGLVRQGQGQGAGTVGWLAASQASAACLALWDGRDSESGVLRVVDVYHPSIDLDPLVGSESAIESFPPLAFVELADASKGEVVYVVPVTARGKDWGLLAIIGGIDVSLLTGRQTLNHWAALLCVAFDHDALLAGIRRSEERYALAAQAANDGLWDWDVATGSVYYSPRWSANLGYDQAEIAPTPESWFDRVHADDLPALRAAIGEGLAGDLRPIEIEHRVRTADGAFRWMLCRAAAVAENAAPATRLVGSLTDIDERKSLEQQLRHGALHDALTGLPNRTLLIDRLTWAIQRSRTRTAKHFAVMFLDLDDFKVVNDSLGHHIGDRLLVEVADRLQHSLRAVDTAARVGGDEFVLLMLDIEPGDVPDLVAKVRASLAEPFDLDGQQVIATASIGVATSRSDYVNADDVLRDADIAMYRAKSEERGSYQIFDTAMHSRAVHRRQTEVELRRAFEIGEFEVRYQPIVDLETRTAQAYEALVRWRHPQRGLILPDDFLAVAEEIGLIVGLGRWVIDEACRQLAEWRTSSGAELSVSVNVSNREFWHAGLVEHVASAVATHGLRPEALKLEITEGVIMRNPELARVQMGELHAQGVALHIDDFGTGYSSLHALHRFPIQGLKIDRSFVAGLAVDTTTMELVRTIIAMGRNLGVDVIAEGVETAEQEQWLRNAGCRYAQGNWFAPPSPGVAAGALAGSRLPVTTQAAGIS